MKTAILFLLCSIGTFVINRLYLEYCVSRPCAEWITISLGIVVIVFDIAMMILAVKTLKKVLKL